MEIDELMKRYNTHDYLLLGYYDLTIQTPTIGTVKKIV